MEHIDINVTITHIIITLLNISRQMLYYPIQYIHTNILNKASAGTTITGGKQMAKKLMSFL